MLLAKPIAEICLVPFSQVKSRTFANAYKSRGICLKAHANGRNIVERKSVANNSGQPEFARYIEVSCHKEIGEGAS